MTERERKINEEIIDYSIDNKVSLIQSTCDVYDKHIAAAEDEISKLKAEIEALF
tara:strand:+ start:174 stop:335 length:162 start_codon:yes stop_codon:yes gene_type:complete